MSCPGHFEMVSAQEVSMWMESDYMVMGKTYDRNADGKLCALEIGHDKHVVRDNMHMHMR